MPMFLKSCFLRAAKESTFRLSLNRWRSVMQVRFKSRHLQATALRDLTERRVRFVLQRLSWLAPRAEAQRSDVTVRVAGSTDAARWN